jgi:hypothetical protein
MLLDPRLVTAFKRFGLLTATGCPSGCSCECLTGLLLVLLLPP